MTGEDDVDGSLWAVAVPMTSRGSCSGIKWRRRRLADLICVSDAARGRGRRIRDLLAVMLLPNRQTGHALRPSSVPLEEKKHILAGQTSQPEPSLARPEPTTVQRKELGSVKFFSGPSQGSHRAQETRAEPESSVYTSSQTHEVTGG